MSEEKYSNDVSGVVRNSIAAFISALLLASIGWVNLNINETKSSILVNQTLQSNLIAQVHKLESTIWTRNEQMASSKLTDLRFKMLEERITGLEVDRKEYVNILRKLVVQTNKARETERASNHDFSKIP